MNFKGFVRLQEDATINNEWKVGIYHFLLGNIHFKAKMELQDMESLNRT